jgi:hypothetical protein
LFSHQSDQRRFLAFGGSSITVTAPSFPGLTPRFPCLTRRRTAPQLLPILPLHLRQALYKRKENPRGPTHPLIPNLRFPILQKSPERKLSPLKNNGERPWLIFTPSRRSRGRMNELRSLHHVPSRARDAGVPAAVE